MNRKILAATDLSPKSAGVLPLAAAQARFQRAALVALHVVGMSQELERAGTSDPETLGRLLGKATDNALRRLTAALRPHARGIEARCLVKIGAPASVIRETARKLRAEWIVVGRGGAGQLGSTAERVVRLTGFTVVVVPARRASGEIAPALPSRAHGSTARRIPARKKKTRRSGRIATAGR